MFFDLKLVFGCWKSEYHIRLLLVFYITFYINFVTVFYLSYITQINITESIHCNAILFNCIWMFWKENAIYVFQYRRSSMNVFVHQSLNSQTQFFSFFIYHTVIALTLCNMFTEYLYVQYIHFWCLFSLFLTWAVSHRNFAFNVVF